MAGRLKESSLWILGPFAVAFAGVAALERYAVDLGRRPSVVRVEAQGAEPAEPAIAPEGSRIPGPGGAPGRRSPESERELREHLARDPDDADLHYSLATLLAKDGRLDEAEVSYRRTLELNPAHQSAATRLGALLTRRGETTAALELLERAVDMSGGKTKARALHALGVARLRAGRPEAAAVALRDAIEYRPGHADSWLQLGHALAAGNPRSPEAERAYLGALRLDASSVEACAGLGRTLAEQGRIPESIELYRRAIDANPYAKAARYDLARLLEENGDPTGAREHYEWLARNESGTGRALLTQGNLALQDGELEAAVELYRRAIEADGASEEPRLRLARALGDLGRHDQALQACRSATERFARSAAGPIGSGRALLALGRTGEALAALDEAVRRDPESGEAWFLRGRVLSRLDRTEEAKRAYRRVLELREADRRAMLNLAVLERQSGHASRAIGLYRKILDRHPVYTPALFNLALTYSKQGHKQEASELYARVLETDPGHQAARLNLAVLARDGGDVPRARSLLEDALLQDPANVPARYNLALLHDATGRPDDALRELRRITPLDGRFSKAWKSLGRVLEATGDPVGALDAYERALELDPGSRMAREGALRCRTANDG